MMQDRFRATLEGDLEPFFLEFEDREVVLPHERDQLFDVF